MLARLPPLRSTLARAPLRRAGVTGFGLPHSTSVTAARIVQRRTYAGRGNGYDGPSTQSEITPDTRKRNAIIATVLFAAAAGVWYWETKTLFEPAEPDLQVTFGSGSRRRTESFKRKTVAEANAMLKEHEETRDIDRPGNPVVRLDSNYLASNEPIEDRSAADVVPRGQPKGSWWGSAAPAEAANKPGKRDLVFVSVIDGHAGDATSQLLSKTLHPTLTIALAGLQSGIIPGHSFWHKIYDWATFSKVWTPSHIADSIKNAFVTLDDNICYGASRMLPTLNRDDPVEMAKFLALAEPAASGAVVGTAVVDAEHDSLYFANAGDCRAVAGWQAPDGSWRCDTLSEDQMGDNPKEVARMRSEHPPHEADTVIRHGRVQGGLQPTRAFGDAVYKWTTKEGEQIAEGMRAAGQPKTRNIRPWNFTPPYVTARPEVTYRQLTNSKGEKLRFVILATDGLWDRLTSEEAAALVASFMTQPKRDDVPKTQLPQELKLTTTEPRPFPVQPLPGTADRAKGEWAFEGDDNAATHLIRNAFGGGDRKERSELLSLHGKASRYFRDDVTVSVLFFNDEE